MRLKLTLFLILLNLALFCTLFYLDKKASSEASFARASRAVLPGGLGEIDELTIEGRDLEQPWVLKRRVEGWEIDEPVQWPANPFAVNRILNQLRFLKKETSFDRSALERSGQRLADYGLDDPKAILTLGRSGRSISIKIGEVTEIGNRLYILSPDEDRVFVVSRKLLDSISIDLNSLRSRQVFPMPIFEIESLDMEISQPEGLKIRLARESKEWKFEFPLQAAADKGRVESTLKGLTSVRIVEFLKETSPEFGLDPPALILTLDSHNRRQTIFVGKEFTADSGELLRFARLGQSLETFTVPAAPFTNLAQAQESLREKRFLRFDPSLLTTIELDMADRVLVLQKLETGTWQVLHTNTQGTYTTWPADGSVMQHLIRSLVGLKAESFVSEAPSDSDIKGYGLHDPQRRVTLRSDREQVLLLGDLTMSKTGSHALFARLEGRAPIYQVHTDILHRVPLSPLHYRLRILEDLSAAAEIESVTITDNTDGRIVLQLERDVTSEATWADVILEVSEEQQPAVTVLLQYIQKFRVGRYIREQYAEVLDLGDKDLPWRYNLQARIVLPGGAQAQKKTMRYTFTDRLGGTTQYGGAPDHDIVFVLDQELIDALFLLTFEMPAPKPGEAFSSDPGASISPEPETTEPPSVESPGQEGV